jgi:hypothetical protein
MKERSADLLQRLLQHLLGISIALTPLVACLTAGSLRASLWLDEVTYWYYEADPALRELEAGRPGDTIARYFLNYFYTDIQRVVHALIEPFGLTIQSDPELYLRFLSLLSFVAAVALVYLVTFRESQSWWWSTTAALLVSASPLMLFYAFEARLSAFATLAVIAYLIVVAAALKHPDRKRYWIAGALLSIFLTHLHLWIVCLLAALGIAALIRSALTRQWRELALITTVTLPGALTLVAEVAYVMLTTPAGGHKFPLYLPQPFLWLQAKTTFGAFSPAGNPFPMPLALAPFLPALVLGIAIGVLIYQSRRSSDVIFPIAALIGLEISIVLGAVAGYLVVPRYQVPLFAALFFSLRLASTRNARLIVTLLVALHVLMIPKAVSDIQSKGNSRDIASVIAAATPRERTAIVVQHGLRYGYPDPLHSFALHFYLDEMHPEVRPLRLYEIPSMKDVTDERGLRNYFGGGDELLSRYYASPARYWDRWLQLAPYDRIWFVAPVPVFGVEHEQATAFREAMKARGFVLVPQHAYRFEGHPQTYVGLFVRVK